MANGNTKKNIEATKQAMDELTFATRDFTDEVQKSAKEVFGIGTQARMVTKAFRDIANVTREIDTDIDDILDGTKTLSDLTKSQAKLEQKKKNLTTEYRIALDKAGVSAKDIAKITSGEADLTDTIVDNYGDISKENAKLLDLFDQQLQTIKDTEEELGDVVDKAAEIESNMGAAGTALGGLGGALKKLGLGDIADKMGIEDAVKSGRQLSASLGGTGKKGKVAAHMISQVGKNFIKAGGPAALLAMAVDKIVAAFKQLDQLSGEVAKGFGVSAAEGEKLVKSMNEAANSSGELDFSTKDLVQAQMQLNQALGTSVKLNDENLKTFTKLRETSGLTNEELMGINKLTLGTNKNLEDATGEILAQAKITGLQNGVSLNQKDILKDIQNVSAATTLSFGKNPKLIAQAVAEAKSLGLNLQKIESITNNILDFESSIQSELEAELLTGKQLNLETARLAALNNDLATVASEVSKNIGDSAEFSKMNRLQQDALAKSVGLSRDDLAETLFIQDQLTGLSKEDAEEKQNILNARIQEVGLAQATRELQGKSLEDLKNQAGIATQFNAIVEKLKEGFVLVGTALMPVFNMISGIVGAFAEFPALIGAVVGGLAAMKVASGLVALKSLSIAVAEIFAGSFGSLGALGLPFAIAGVAALGAAVAGVSSMLADDMFSPPPGYGKRTLTGPEGSIALNNKDTVIAGTDLLGGNNTTNNQNATVDNTALISKVDKLIAVNERILAKSSVIEMNGNQVGQEINTSERAIQ